MQGQDVEIIPLRGGLDLVTPHMMRRPGAAIGGRNYEADAEGYKRFIGYECLDGRPKPSAATYWTVDLMNSVSVPALGSTVTGATSGATGLLVVDATATQMVLEEITGTFQVGEEVQVSSVTFAEVEAAAVQEGALQPSDHQDWLALSADLRRARIGQPTGSGPIRGVAAYDGDYYCWRDNAGGTACVMFKATTSGWTEVDIGYRLAFTDGTQPNFGTSLAGATSGATATIMRVVTTSGDWEADTAAGFLFIKDITGTFVDGELLNTSLAGGATASGSQIANGFPAGGHYQTLTHNFFGNIASKRLYGCNGVGPAFEFDGANFAFVYTGLSDALEKPTHIAEFAYHLWLGYAPGSWQHSALGEPLDFVTAGANGAGEIAVGAVPTGAVRAATVLVLFCDTRVDYVSGTSASDFQVQPVSQDSGALAYTAQQVNTPFYMDGGAIRALTQTEALGGWRMGSASQAIEPLFRDYRDRGVSPVASMRVRGRDLYRVFMSDKTVISVYLGRGDPEIMILELPVQASCAYSGAEGDDFENVLIGAEDGYVYELDRDTRFNGADIDAWVRLAFYTKRTRWRYRWHKAVVEGDFPNPSDIQIAAEVDYGEPSAPPTLVDVVTQQGGGFWDRATWGTFVWSAKVVGEGTALLNKIGHNITIGFDHTGSGEPAHTLQMLSLYRMQRGLKRR